jgi:hypothetical protein
MAHNGGCASFLEYWQSLASSIKLVGWTLEECLVTLHRDIALSWNFYDPHNVSSLPCVLWVITLI